MQQDFHYYATYCASVLAGYTHDESLVICYAAELADHCSRSYLASLGAPLAAATTQLTFEMANARTDIIGLQDITRIWASFHFLPYDLYADPGRGTRRYRNKYRLICGPNGELVADTVRLAKGKGLEAAGLAMHVLADTWAHRFFAGTPSLVINNMSRHAYELVSTDDVETERPITFVHRLGSADDLEKGIYANTPFQTSENAVMNLGHGRAGHLPDYSFARYRYLPAWGDYKEVVKDNPSDYHHAFCQMVYGLGYLRGTHAEFETGRYDTESVRPWEPDIQATLHKRQASASEDWKALATRISGHDVEDFDLDRHRDEFLRATPDSRDNTFLGRFVLAALAQKSMVTNRIYASGSMLAGRSIEYGEGAIGGIRDYLALVRHYATGGMND